MIKENIYYSKPYLDNSDLNCLKTVFKSNFLTQGPKINEFEKISSFVNAKYSTGFNSATSALHAACYSLGFRKKIFYGRCLILLWLQQTVLDIWEAGLIL